MSQQRENNKVGDFSDLPSSKGKIESFIMDIILGSSELH